MPTYEYICPKCHHAFEAFQSMSAPPLTQCPKCKKRGLKRLIGGGAGLIFKGTGFYITDYKNKKAPEKAAPEKAAGEKAGGEKAGGEKPVAPKPVSKPAATTAA